MDYLFTKKKKSMKIDRKHPFLSFIEYSFSDFFPKSFKIKITLDLLIHFIACLDAKNTEILKSTKVSTK